MHELVWIELNESNYTVKQWNLEEVVVPKSERRGKKKLQLLERTLGLGVSVPQKMGGDGTWMASSQKDRQQQQRRQQKQQQQRTPLNNMVDISTMLDDTVMQVISVSAV